MKRIFYMAVFIFVILSMCSCMLNDKEMGNIVEQEGSFMAMDTVISYKVYAPKSIEVDQLIKKIVLDIEQEMSRTIEDSALSKLNAAAGNENGIVLTPGIRELLEESITYQARSDADFRITIYPLVVLWDIMNPDKGVPSEAEIARALELSNPGMLKLEGDRAFLKNAGSGVDLGAVAKGYAADKVVTELEKTGASAGLISFGGGVSVFGYKPGNKLWSLGLEYPFAEGPISVQSYYAILKYTDMSINTSGVYQRRKIIDGKVYHHLFDPKTGYPAQNDLAAVSIIDESATRADAFSTAVYVKGFKEGLKLVEEEGLEAIFVFNDKTYYITPGLSESIRISNSEFKPHETGR